MGRSWTMHYFRLLSFCFFKHCTELDLPRETYDLEQRFGKANNEWCEELMIIVADS